MKRKCQITIKHGSSQDSFQAEIIDEGDKFFKVIHETNKEIGEWLPKESDRINIKEIE